MVEAQFTAAATVRRPLSEARTYVMVYSQRLGSATSKISLSGPQTSLTSMLRFGPFQHFSPFSYFITACLLSPWLIQCPQTLMAWQGRWKVREPF